MEDRAGKFRGWQDVPREFFKNISESAKAQKNVSVFQSMIKVISENDGDCIKELLAIIASYFDEKACISIVDSKSREILYTSCDKEEKLPDIEIVAKKVKEVRKKCFFYRNEKNGIWFREDFQCNFIIPFQEMGQRSCFLMMEQVKCVDLDLDRMFDLLSISVRMALMEKDVQDARNTDLVTGLPNRECLLEAVSAFYKEEDVDLANQFIGMFFILNDDDLNLGEGMTKVDLIYKSAGAYILKCFKKNAYRFNHSAFCVWIKGMELFDATAKVQDCLDELIRNLPQVDFSSVICPLHEDMYTTFYQCEKLSKKAVRDAVLVIREKEIIEDGESETYLSFLPTEFIKEYEREEEDELEFVEDEDYDVHDMADYERKPDEDEVGKSETKEEPVKEEVEEDVLVSFFDSLFDGLDAFK